MRRYDLRLMLLKELPLHLHPEKLCRTAPPGGKRLDGKILLSNLKNLNSELRKQEGKEVTVSLVFSVDQQGYCCVEGEISVELSLICQRCMQPMTQTVSSSIVVSPVVSDAQAKQLPARYEPLLMNEGEVALEDWIAEELLLALPLVPRHEAPCLPNKQDGESN